MAFAKANFAPAGNTSKPLSGVGTQTVRGAPSIWSYATADLKNTVTAANYFLEVIRELNVGDLIFAVTGAGSGGTLVPCLLVVNAKNITAKTIDVSDGTNITMTDTY